MLGERFYSRLWVEGLHGMSHSETQAQGAVPTWGMLLMVGGWSAGNQAKLWKLTRSLYSDLLYVTSSRHISLAEASHIAKPNMNRVEKYTSPMEKSGQHRVGILVGEEELFVNFRSPGSHPTLTASQDQVHIWMLV